VGINYWGSVHNSVRLEENQDSHLLDADMGNPEQNHSLLARLRNDRDYRELLIWRLVAASTAGLAGLALNLFPIRIYGNGYLGFGGIFPLAILLTLGPAWSVAASLPAYLPTLWIWGHPFGLLIGVLTPAVSALVARLRPKAPMAVAAYVAATLMGPLAIAELLSSGYWPHLHKWEVVLRAPFNGIFNVSVAVLLVEMSGLFRWLPPRLKVQREGPLRVSLVAGFITASMVPFFLVFLEQRRTFERDLRLKFEYGLTDASGRVASELDKYVGIRQEALNSLTLAVGQTPVSGSTASLLRAWLRRHPEFCRLNAATPAGRLSLRSGTCTPLPAESIRATLPVPGLPPGSVEANLDEASFRTFADRLLSGKDIEIAIVSATGGVIYTSARMNPELLRDTQLLSGHVTGVRTLPVAGTGPQAPYRIWTTPPLPVWRKSAPRAGVW
jgi:hypothetical protein